MGARIRRWWYRTNNWPLNNSARSPLKDKKLAKEVGEVSFRDFGTLHIERLLIILRSTIKIRILVIKQCCTASRLA